ncbi:LysR family substrate-binding domain-containing protein [Myxococcus sp. MxC21-1]|nr:LysR family substrate-binding domain-containing protein [Myxococcus sp. MxC21-1]WNZ60998.1 LysR family substrate-binding domain-containing protein [Myxococcus sp. MxC21-1]
MAASWRGDRARHRICQACGCYATDSCSRCHPRRASDSAPRQLAELAGAPFVWFDPLRSAAHHRFLLEQCRQAGFTPRIAQVGSDIPTLIGLVAAGMGYAFVPETISPTCPRTVRLVPIDELDGRFDVEFVYDGQADSPVVQQFLAALRTTANT